MEWKRSLRRSWGMSKRDSVLCEKGGAFTICSSDQPEYSWPRDWWWCVMDLFTYCRLKALVRPNGRYLAEASTVSYAPSATSFHLLSKEKNGQRSRSMLGVGAVGYTHSSLNTADITRGNQRFRFTELPSSGDEIRAAADAL